MKSDIIRIDTQGNGFDSAIRETRKTAAYAELSRQDSLKLELCAEEMLSLVRIVTGEMHASFWIEKEDTRFELHLTTQTVMDKEKRAQLISAASSRKNDAANSFLGKLRDMFEESICAEVDHSGEDLPSDVLDDIANRVIECTDPEWDGYEQSTLHRLADRICIGIRGKTVDMSVVKYIR